MTDWPVKTLGDVCDLVGGGTPSKDRLEFYGGDIPWATVRDLNVEVLRTTEHSITAEAVKSSSSNVIPAGSVVIATRVGLGKAVIIAQDTAINQDLRGLVVKKPKELIADYLYWWYLSNVHLVVAAGTGATVQGVKLPFVSGLAIPVPPLEEQKRIVALLDAATARITELTACYERARAHANDLFTSALCYELESNPDWPVKTLGEVCDLVNGATPDTKVKDYWGGKHAWITPAEMGGLDSPFLSISRRTLSDKGLASCSATLVPPKTVILSSRAPIGHLVINEVPMATNQGCKSLIPTESLDFKFLYYYLKANVQLLESLGTGTTFKELSGTQLKSVGIPVPPLEEQKRIVARLDSIRAKTSEMVAAYDAKLIAAKNLRQSILEAAFGGICNGS